MSLYNMLMGENKDAAVLLGVLRLNKQAFQRYRDIYLNKEGTKIIVYTRLGGGNRPNYAEVFETMRKHPNYIYDYDDKFDSTYCYFEFSIPDKYKDMCKKIAPNEDPLTVDEKFKKEIEEMGKPGSEASKRAEQIANMIISEIEDGSNDNNGIPFIKL